MVVGKVGGYLGKIEKFWFFFVLGFDGLIFVIFLEYWGFLNFCFKDLAVFFVYRKIEREGKFYINCLEIVRFLGFGCGWGGSWFFLG